MPIVVAVGIGLVAATFLVTGLAFLTAGIARPAGAFLTLASGATATYMAGTLVENEPASNLGFTIAWSAYTLALVSFPTLRLRDPVDLLVMTAAAGLPTMFLVLGRPFRPATLEDDSTVFLFVLACLLLVRTYWRLEQSGGNERRATAWLAFAAGTAWLGGALVAFGAPSTAGAVIVTGLHAMVAPCLWIGLRHPDWVDVRGLASLVAVTLTTALAYVATFMVAASALELMGRNPPVYALAVVGAVAATGFHPLRQHLRSAVDEMLFGTRPDPLDAAGQVADQFSDDPQTALDAIREALALPYVALRHGLVDEATSGQPVPHLRDVPLPGGGVLVVGLRPGDLALPPADERALRLVAPLLAQGLRAGELARDLQAARERTIRAREEERRRLRRDLHDGLGPRLSGIAFTADAARNQLQADPATAEQLLQAVRAEIGTAIGEIRELVYGMRPPALDELGLLPAVLQATSLLRTQRGDPLVVDVDAPALPSFPAAVEVAAYRIIVESLSNVSRHSTSPDASVTVAVTEQVLEIDVSDRGGPSGPWQPGVGLSSMRERAEELGGWLEVSSGSRGGRVRAVLPLPGRRQPDLQPGVA
jgi:signal transduction histidine kinase